MFYKSICNKSQRIKLPCIYNSILKSSHYFLNREVFMLAKIPKEFSTERSRHGPSYAMKNLHFHQVNEFFFLQEGECTIQIDNDIYRISAGTFIMIPAGCLHKTTYLSPNYHERVLVYFPNLEMNWFLKELGQDNIDLIFKEKVIKIPAKRVSYINNLLEQINYELNGVDEMSTAMAKAYFYELLLFIMRCDKYSDSIVQKLNVSNLVIQSVIDYICKYYYNNISLADVAIEFGMSESSLSKKFKTFSGFRFKEYLIGVRMKAAENYLLNTDKSITEISDLCGFNDSNFFGDSFKKFTGVSPNNFRKRI